MKQTTNLLKKMCYCYLRRLCNVCLCDI